MMAPRVLRICLLVGTAAIIIVCINIVLLVKHEVIVPLSLPDYFAGNNYRTARREQPRRTVWPNPEEKLDDRILLQMGHVPENYSPDSPMKTIYLLGFFAEGSGSQRFLNDHCPVSQCTVSLDHTQMAFADAVVYQPMVVPMPSEYSRSDRPPHQIWVFYQQECPNIAPPEGLATLNNWINWTATYRPDSTLPTPYRKFIPFDNITDLRPAIDFSVRKTKLVAWMVSHCLTRSGRENYVKELQKHIQVDVYGMCGNLTCPRNNRECFKIIQEYKFYLAFENGNCDYYITEKLFQTAFQNAVVPVVFGARKEDYIHVSPPNSFIFAGDFSSPKALADYLIQLNNDPIQYNSYLAWYGRGHFINTKFYCRLCALLHSLDTEPSYVHSYEDLDTWWNGPQGNKTCRNANKAFNR